MIPKCEDCKWVGFSHPNLICKNPAHPNNKTSFSRGSDIYFDYVEGIPFDLCGPTGRFFEKKGLNND